MSRFGKYVVEQLDFLGINGAALARAIGVSEKTLSNNITGGSPPSVKNLYLISYYLDMDLDKACKLVTLDVIGEDYEQAE